MRSDWTVKFNGAWSYSKTYSSCSVRSALCVWVSLWVYVMESLALSSVLLCLFSVALICPVNARIGKRALIGACPARCDKSRCPALSARCVTELALDACNCCAVCASGEGEACVGAGGARRLGDPVCARGLRCVESSSSSSSSPSSSSSIPLVIRRRPRTAVCVCTSEEPVCGSDGVSYRSACELKRASERAQELQQSPVLLVHKGACGEGEALCVCVLNADKPHISLLIQYFELAFSLFVFFFFLHL